MLTFNHTKFILKRSVGIGQPSTRNFVYTRPAYFNGVKSSPTLPPNPRCIRNTAFFATQALYRSTKLSNVRSVSSSCMGDQGDVNKINTEIIDRHLESYSKLPDQGVPYNDNFLVQTVYYKDSLSSRDSSHYFGLAVEWLYTKNLAPPRDTNPGIDSPSLWKWNPISMYALAHILDNKKLLNAVMDQWIESDVVHKCFPSLGFVAEVYSELPAESPPRKYASWVLYWITRQRRKDSDWVVDDIQNVMKKHPELKDDFRKHLEEEKVCKCIRDPRKVSRDTFHH